MKEPTKAVYSKKDYKELKEEFKDLKDQLEYYKEFKSSALNFMRKLDKYSNRTITKLCIDKMPYKFSEVAQVFNELKDDEYFDDVTRTLHFEKNTTK